MDGLGGFTLCFETPPPPHCMFQAGLQNEASGSVTDLLVPCRYQLMCVSAQTDRVSYAHTYAFF